MYARMVVTICLAVVWVGSSVGCQTIQPYGGLLEQKASTTAGLSSLELRAMLDDYVKRFADDVEATADQILAQETDRQIRINALLWKTNGISTCFQAASRSDALSAFFDIWILNKQSIALLEHTSDTPLFGRWQGLALQTCRQLDQPLVGIQSRIGTDFPIGEDFVISFARDHPISDLYFRRASIAARYTDYIERIEVTNKELMDVVSGLDQRLDQLHKLSALYAEFLPKQARWQSELMLMESLPSSILAAPLEDLSVTAGAIDRLAAVGEALPQLVERERDHMLKAVTQERMAALDAVDQMLGETMAQLRDERVAVVDAMRTERVLVGQELSAYADALLAKSEPALTKGLDEITERGVFLTDHTFKRLAQLGILTLIFMTAMLLIVMRLRPNRGVLHVATTNEVEDDVVSGLHRYRKKAA